MTITHFKKIHHQAGLAALEFVLFALPAMLIVAFATIEYGRLLSQYNTLTKTTRDAAKYLASTVRPPNFGSDAKYQAAVTNATNLALCGSLTCTGANLLADLSASNVQIDYPVSGLAGITHVRVRVSNYSTGFITSLGALLNSGDYSKQAFGPISVTMRQVQQ